jgi:hypothetical protein
MRRTLTLIPPLLLTGALAAVQALASPSTVPSIRAAGTARDQRMPAVVFSPDTQEYLAFWSEDRGSGLDLYFKRLFANGLPEGGPQRTGSPVLRDAGPREPFRERRAPAVAYNADPEIQEYVLVWTERHDDADGNDVYLQRLAANGFARGAPRVVAGGPGDQTNPAVAYNPDRREYFVVWSDNKRDVDDIWAQKVRANGVPFGKPIVLVQNQTNAQDPTVARRGSDGYTLAWVDDRDGKPTIYGRRINENGIAIGGPMGQDYALSAGPDDHAAPALDPANGTLVYNAFNARTGWDVVGLEVYDNGTTRGARSVGISVPAADQTDPAVALNSSRGELAVLYADNRSGQNDLYAIRVQNSRPKGRDYAVLLDGVLP